MTTNSGLFTEIALPPKLPRYLSPFWQLIMMAVLIFSAEMIAMGLIYVVRISNPVTEALLDGSIMLLLISPVLYLFQMRPVLRHMKERDVAHKAMRESEKLLRTVLRLLPVGVWITDAQGKFIHGNPASQEIWGGARYVGIDQYSEYKGWWLESGKRIQPEEWAASRAVQHGETCLNEEIEIESFDGTHKIILNSGTPIMDENLVITGAIIVNQDITEVKRAEQALKERDALFRTAMENLPVGVWLTDQSGTIIYGNPAGQQIWTGARYVGIEQFGEYKGWWVESGQLIEPEEWAIARAITKGETSLNEEIEIECFDGTHKIILNSAIPIRNDQGHILWAFVVNHDITDRKQHEQELIHTNELLARYFSSIDTLIAYMDRDFNFIRVNDSYASSGGHPAEYFIGKNHFEMYPHAENEAIFQQVVETGEPYSVLEKPFEYPEFPERGTTYWDWSVQPVRGIDGKIQGVVLSLVDVTERKRAELLLERQNQELLEVSEAERRQRELAESLVQSVIAVNSSVQFEEVLESILEQIRRAIPYEGADIVLVKDSSLRLAGNSGYESYPRGVIAMEGIHMLEDFPIFSQICTSLEPVIIEDTVASEDWRVVPGLEWVRSYMAAPLITAGKIIGIINLTSETPHIFNTQSLEKLMVLASPAAAALRNAQLFNAELTSRRATETLSTASMALAQSLDLDQVLRTLMQHINKIIPSDISGVGLLDEEDRLGVRVANGYPRWTGPDFIFSLPVDVESDTLFDRVITSQKYQLVTDTAIDPLSVSQPEVEHIRNWLLVPIVTHNKTIGLVGLGKTEPGYFTHDHIQWVEALTSQAAVAIQNAWLFEQVRSSSERLQSLARKLVDIQEKERSYIARELHDEAGQALAILKIGLGRLEHSPDCPETMHVRLQELKGLADTVLEDLHRLAMDLRPTSLDHLGLVAALEQHANTVNSDQLSVELKVIGVTGVRLSPAVETSLYRIAQEALTNVVRHSQASTVGILLENRGGTVTLFIEDDGIGFNPETSDVNRLGMVGMRERAELLGGTLTVESITGKGTSIKVEVPHAIADPHR